MNLEGSWPVHIGDRPIGQCDFMPQGLYWKMRCTIREGWEGVSRLVLFHDGEPVSLGIPAPQGVVLTLERQIPRKRLPGEGEFYLELLPADAPLLSRRASKRQEAPLPESIPEESPMEESLAEAVPEESPTEESLAESTPEESPTEESLAESTPEESPTEESLAESTPEESPTEESLAEAVLEESPTEESLAESTPEESPTAESLAEAVPEESPTEESPGDPVPEDILFCPGDKLPPLVNWQDFRAKPSGNGGFILHHRQHG